MVLGGGAPYTFLCRFSTVGMLHLSLCSELIESPSSGCSSTPHAPRLLHRPLRLNKQTAAQPGFSKPPSAVPAVTVAAPSDAKTIRTPPPSNENVSQRNKFIQPYRSRIYKKTPKIVPELDLSQLNQPDNLLQPVELFHRWTPSKDTSPMSWGIPGMADMEQSDELHLMDCEDDAMSQSCQSDSIISSSVPPSVHTNFLKRSQLDFIEGKLRSHECSKPDVAMDTMASTPGFTTGTYAPTLSISVPPITTSPFAVNHSLDNKLQFEARIATHNGRDVHRQLCGYFFLTDGSLTVYEFRQFGKRSSALPLIHRGEYGAITGRRKGHPYKISDIRKGSTLQFATAEHPNLPASLASRAVLYIKINHVDEDVKKQLVCAGYERPEEIHKRLQTCMLSPKIPSSLKEARLLATMQGMLCHRLSGRACLVLVGLGRYLLRVCEGSVVNFNQLEKGLRTFHISLTTEDMTTFWGLLPATDLWSEAVDGLYLDHVLHTLTGVFTEDLVSIVRQVFMKLDVYQSGLANFDQMKKLFRKPESKCWQEMMYIFQQHSTQNVSYADFENFNIGLRLELSSNSKFINELKACWGI